MISTIATKDVIDNVLAVVDAICLYGWQFRAASRWYWPEPPNAPGWVADGLPHAYRDDGVTKVQISTHVSFATYMHGGSPDGGIGATRWDVWEELWEIPPKVIDSALHRLVTRGLLSGCATMHNCRGDFTVTEAGRAAVAA